MAKAIELNGINKIYGTAIRTQVLFDIDLAFEEQSFNSIIGQSGSGKSTLMNIMGTLDRPTSGTVTIGGIQTGSMRKNNLAVVRNETIGFIFQFHYLLPEFTALENVLMPYLIKHNRPTAEVRERANELMELVGLGKVKNNLATQMSGGQQQRTAIARALIMNPKIILADEPTGNLDSDTTEIVYEILRKVNSQFKTTFVIITHDRKIAEKADRIVEIRDGRISLDIARPII
ncbi:MAG: ABC transporter ATP-binding protein [Clostridiaceae bacterium]|nr:ABC transporter ATP-binding protein [Clostridiaceae bacterium]